MRLAPAYFDQFRSALDEEAALAEVISPGSEYVEIGGRRKHVVGYLGDFLFAAERARSPVKSLSGGERNRLLLARLFSRPANVLVLDEPTNDLDIETLELLEGLLVEFEGTVLLVSHDRTFLDNVVTQVIAAEGQGMWRETVGGYADWQRQRPATAEAPPAREKPVPAQRPAPQRPGKLRLSFKEARELEGLPARIEQLEAEHRAAAARLADPALYRDRAGEVAGVKQRLADLEAEIERAMARWEELERLAGN
jgi:ATP-binding cassette subfamily F protein uup